MMIERYNKQSGFTLIELSIVLVIIGLLAGGVLVGRNLISAAGARAQVAQIEKLNTAVNTFREKYNCLPGDMPPSVATLFNFSPTNRAGTQGRGDGNGVIDAYANSRLVVDPSWDLGGETSMFWGDLSTARLVDGNFTLDQTDNNPAAATVISTLLPPGKIGNNNNVIAVFSYLSINYFTLQNITSITATGTYQCPGANVATCAGLTVSQAYNIDKKVDDGLPTTGTVQANIWVTVPMTNAVTDTRTTCYNTTGPSYSLTFGNSDLLTCALSFRFQ